jgi:hypothetical protein
MLSTINQLQPFSLATRAQINQLRSHVFPLNSNALPSIVRLWEDTTESSAFYVNDKYSLVRFKGFEHDAEWVIGGRLLLSKADWRQISATITDLDGHINPTVKLISDNIISDEMRVEFSPLEMDEDYADYIYDCAEQAACSGGKFEDMRRQTRLYFKQYGMHTKIKVDATISNSILTKESVMHLFDDWLDFGTDGTEDPGAEAHALSVFFDKKNRKFFGELVIIRVLYQNKLVAFSVCEIIDDEHAINHFHKTNLNLSGISYYTFYSMMELLHQKGIRYLNFQEDVGIPGLRSFKHKMRPAIIDKRYLIQL